MNIPDVGLDNSCGYLHLCRPLQPEPGEDFAMLLGLATFVASLVTLSLSDDLPLPYTYPPVALPNTTSLYFGLLQSFGGTYDSSGSIPGVELALDNINRNQTLLPGYTLHYVLRDTFVSHLPLYNYYTLGAECDCMHNTRIIIIRFRCKCALLLSMGLII